MNNEGYRVLTVPCKSGTNVLRTREKNDNGSPDGTVVADGM